GRRVGSASSAEDTHSISLRRVRMSKHFPIGLALAVAAAGLVLLTQLGAKDPPESKKEAPKTEAAATPVKPKPISEHVKKGLAYLINQQHADGGWGQGGGWRAGRQSEGRRQRAAGR